MRRAERTLAPAPRREPAGDRRHGRDFERLVLGQRRQQRGQPLREHRLAGAGRPDQQQRVRAGRGDLERALRVRLAAHVGQVGDASGAAAAAPRPPRQRRARRSGARTPRAAIARRRPWRPAPARLRPPTPPAARTRGRRAARTAPSRARRAPRAARRSAPARRRIRSASRSLRGNLPGRRQDAERDRQVVAAGLLRQVGGRQVDGDLARGNSNCAFCSAARTRSRASRTSVSGRPTRWMPGRPPAMWTSTVTRGARRRRARGCAGRRRVMRQTRRSLARLPARGGRDASSAKRRPAGRAPSSSATRASRRSSFSRVLSSTAVCVSNSARVTTSRRGESALAASPSRSFRCPWRGWPRRPCRSARRVRRGSWR